MLFRLAFAVAVLAACHPRSNPGPQRDKPDPGPPVNEACLAQAANGTLIASQPAEVAGFTVTPTDKGVRMVRTGRALTESEGKAVWMLFSEQYFGRGGFSSGHSAMYSVDKCPDVGDASCLSLSTYICQRDLATIGGWVAEAAERSGAPDGELAIDLTFMERRGPRCTGPTCAPTPHYSTPKARYDADDDRDVVDWGRGRCASDGDCDGGGNLCQVWWLSGGAENLIYEHYDNPTMCGCVEQTCAWFTQ